MSSELMRNRKGKYAKLLRRKVLNAEWPFLSGCEIQMLKETVAKVNLAIILPNIFEKPKILDKVLSGTQYEPVIKMINDFVQRSAYVRFRNTSFLNHKLVRLFDYLQENHGMLSLFPTTLSVDLAPDDIELLNAVKVLFNLAEHHLSATPENVLEKEQKLHSCYIENLKMKESIAKMKNDLIRERLNLRWKISAKEAYTQQLNEEEKERHLLYQLYVRDVRAELTEGIHDFRRKHWKYKMQLMHDLRSIQDQYEMQNKTRSISMMKANQRRNDTLKALREKIGAYDRSMAKKFKTKLGLQESYALVTEKLKDAQIVHGFEMAQCELYEVVEQERTEYRRTNFVINGAVKKIQRYWRIYQKLKIIRMKRLAMEKKLIEKLEREERKKLILAEKREMLQKQKEERVRIRKEKNAEKKAKRAELKKIQREARRRRKLIAYRERKEKRHLRKMAMRMMRAKRMEQEMERMRIQKELKMFLKEKKANEEKERRMAKKMDVDKKISKKVEKKVEKKEDKKTEKKTVKKVDKKVEQKIDQKLDQMMVQKMNKKIKKMNQKMGKKVDKKVDKKKDKMEDNRMDEKMYENVDQEIDQMMVQKLDEKIKKLDLKMDKKIDKKMDPKMDKTKSSGKENKQIVRNAKDNEVKLVQMTPKKEKTLKKTVAILKKANKEQERDEQMAKSIEEKLAMAKELEKKISKSEEKVAKVLSIETLEPIENYKRKKKRGDRVKFVV